MRSIGFVLENEHDPLEARPANTEHTGHLHFGVSRARRGTVTLVANYALLLVEPSRSLPFADSEARSPPPFLEIGTYLRSPHAPLRFVA